MLGLFAEQQIAKAKQNLIALCSQFIALCTESVQKTQDVCAVSLLQAEGDEFPCSAAALGDRLVSVC